MYSNRLVNCIFVLLFICLSNCVASRPREPYYGTVIGQFEAENVKGKAYAVDEETVFIKDFSYEESENDTYFAVLQGGIFADAKFILNTEICGLVRCPLSKIEKQDVLLRLPPGDNLKNIDLLMISTVNEDVASIHTPEGINIPKHRILPEFSRRAHRLRSGNITILDARTFLIPDLHYDGKGPDAYFWVGNGTVNEKGMRIPNENNLVQPLKEYKGENIIIQLPPYLTVYDIEYLAMWCVKFKHNFGEVFMPKDLHVPPALGQHTPKTIKTVPKLKTKEVVVEGVKPPIVCKSGTATNFPSNLLYFIIIFIVSRFI